jgi:diguanylate cyclase (GGDEF)-like protein
MKLNSESHVNQRPLRSKLWVVYFLMFVLPAAYLLYVIGEVSGDHNLTDRQAQSTKVLLLIGVPALLVMSAAAFITLVQSLGKVTKLLRRIEGFLGEFKTADIPPPPPGDEAAQVSHYVQGMMSEFQRHLSALDHYAEDLQAANVRLTDLALIDEQTGLYNAKHGLRVLEVESQRAIKNSYPLAILRVDIADLVKFRTAHGESATGDAVRTMGKHLLDRIRGVDSVAHLGEGRFLVLLPETGSEGAGIVAERMRTSARELSVANTSAPEEGRSLIIGRAACTGEMDSATRMMERAEADLQQNGVSPDEP